MRRTLLTLSAALALAVVPAESRAQLNFGIQGSVISSVEDIAIAGVTEEYALAGTFGLGARVVVSPPILPFFWLVGSGDYYFTNCPVGLECSLWTAQATANFGLPSPIVKPYLLGGLQYRQDDVGSTTGGVLGLGVQLNFAVSLFVEGMFEFADPRGGEIPSAVDLGNPFVLKAGLAF